MNILRVLVVLLLTFTSFAGVNLKNGNFYISYTDIIVPGGGKDLQVVRTYNSRSANIGWFGVGWGSDFETRLSPSADGSVIVFENGSGARTRFTPKRKIDPVAAAKKIVSKMRKSSAITKSNADKLIKKLAGDAELRQAYARKYDVKAKLAKGTVLYSNQRGLQELHITKTGYRRKLQDGKSEYFDKKGRMIKITHKDGYALTIMYGKNNRPKSIRDSQAKQLSFDWYQDGKIKSVWSVGNKKTHYKFKGFSLVYSKDVDSNIYEYEYDKNYNLTKIKYEDKSSMTIAYSKKSQFAESVTSRTGSVKKYEYGSNPKNPDHHYWTYVKKKGINGIEIKNKYEYEIKKKADGSEYTYRIFTVINNVETETIYSECCSLPIKIERGRVGQKKGRQKTTFKYNKKGLLERKESSRGEFVELDYHKKFNKITKVRNNQGVTKFVYDRRGNLQKAVNDKGKAVLLLYNHKGQITKMTDRNQKTKKTRVLTFKYNALGKPIEINMQKVGKINVAYDNYGEIKRVNSKAGHKMAVQVTQAFQSLLAIVKPAGVNLNL